MTKTDSFCHAQAKKKNHPLRKIFNPQNILIIIFFSFKIDMPQDEEGNETKVEIVKGKIEIVCCLRTIYNYKRENSL